MVVRVLGYSKIVAIFIGFLLAAFLGLSLMTDWYQYKEETGEMMVQEIQQLAGIFSRIERTAGIIDFDYQKNPINFLTIKKDGFVSSEVGSMNLMYPDRWEGPYINRTPTMQSKEYQVVYTHKGYFITPGDGVVLPNKKVVGRDILLDEQSDIEALMRDPQGLMFEGKSLAAPMVVGRQSFIVPSDD